LKIRDLIVRLTRNWPAKIISLTAAILLFLFYQFNSMEERFFSVPVELELNEGFVPAGPYPKSARIILRGEEDSIFLVQEDDIRVYVDLSSHNTEGIFRAPLKYEKSGTAQRINPLEIRIEPHEATVELERKMVGSARVVPVIHGYPEEGYELTEYFTVPEEVEVEGPRSHVTEIDTVQTEAVDLTGRSTDFTVRLMIESTDPYITFRGGDVVEFVGIIREAVMVKTYEKIKLTVLGLPEGYQVEMPQIRGTVKVQGTQLFLEDFQASGVEMFVDCSGITEPGTHELEVRLVVPEELLVLSYEPETVEIGIRGGPPEEEEEEEE